MVKNHIYILYRLSRNSSVKLSNLKPLTSTLSLLSIHDAGNSSFLVQKYLEIKVDLECSSYYK